MKRIYSTVVLLATYCILTGCIVAPLPLVETESKSVWYGEDGDGKKSEIMEEAKTWYLPIVASVDGPAKIRRESSVFRYYFTTPDMSGYRKNWQKLVELTWLKIETEQTGYWRDISRLAGTPLWRAYRVAGREETAQHDKPIWTFEIVVFDREALVRSATIRSSERPDKYDRNSQAIEYKSPTGARRLQLLTGIDELTDGNAK